TTGTARVTTTIATDTPRVTEPTRRRILPSCRRPLAGGFSEGALSLRRDQKGQNATRRAVQYLAHRQCGRTQAIVCGRKKVKNATVAAFPASTTPRSR